MESLTSLWDTNRAGTSRQGAALEAREGVPLSLGIDRGPSFEDDYGGLAGEAS